jgi:hypothetical protein
MAQTLKLRDAVYEALQEAARRNGLAPEEWIAAQLLPPNPETHTRPTAKALARANARLRKHIVASGQRGSCDNEQIDADLAREYGADLPRRFVRDKR